MELLLQSPTTPLTAISVFVYDSVAIRSLFKPSYTVRRSTRKTLFALYLWRPGWQRQISPLLADGREPLLPSSASSPPPQRVEAGNTEASSPSGSSSPPSPLLPTIQSSSDGLKLGSLNAHSLGNKYMEVSNLISLHSLDILTVTESWHSTAADVSVRRSAPPGYSSIDAPRPVSPTKDPLGQNYGGIVVHFRDHLRVKKISPQIETTSFESLAFSCATSRGPLTVLALYRPGSVPVNAAFFAEFSSLLEVYSTFNSQLLITGDLNIHLENTSLPETTRFLDLLSQFGLTQHVAEPTHALGGWLDVVITRDDCKISDLTVEPPSISDHGLVRYTVPLLCAQPTFALRHSRGWRRLDRKAFRDGLLSSPLCGDLSSLADRPCEDLFALYDSAIRPLIDDLLPLRQHRTRVKPLQPWLDQHCRMLRRNVRRLERRYRRTRLPSDRLTWINHLRDMYREFRLKETSYWESLIDRERGNPRRLWAAIADVLGRSTAPSSPPQTSFTADDYLNFVQTKIDSTRKSTENSPPPVFSATSAVLSSWKSLQPDAIRQLILDSSSKSCELDLLPPFLVKEFLDELVPFLAILCNSSLVQGYVPALHKRAVVFPSLKRQGLDPGSPSNYRPISNLSFLSKLLEKCVSVQLVHYLDLHSLMPPLQSGFRKFHSTESLMVSLLADVFHAVDRGHVTLLSLYDISAAFDTVDHSILLDRLSISFGITDSALLWLRSFLTDRSVSVVFGSTRSSWAHLPYGLPQGSVLAPLLFILYTSDLAGVLGPLGVLSHQYADDTQAYLHGPANTADVMVERILEASAALDRWLSSNRLRLNQDKTQYIWLGTRAQLAKIDTDSLCLKFPNVHFSSSVRDLGFILDPVLSLSDHVNSVSRSCFYYLRQLRAIRQSLPLHAITTLVHALICARIDYGNAVYIGLSSTNTSKLQAILNAAARLIGGIAKFDHISSFIRDSLHWLPIRQRIQFKVCSLMRNCLAGSAPHYLRSYCTPVSSLPSRSSLRSSARGHLVVPRVRTSMAQSRSFAIVGPTSWNRLPQFLRADLLSISFDQFRKRLKTSLYQ